LLLLFIFFIFGLISGKKCKKILRKITSKDKYSQENNKKVGLISDGTPLSKRRNRRKRQDMKLCLCLTDVWKV